jgi:hypothetical protein
MDGGSPTAWAKARGTNDSSAREKWRTIRERAAKAGYAPEQGFEPSTCPPGFTLDKSTVHAKDGVTIQRWDRVSADKKMAQEAVLNAISEACNGLKQAPKVVSPKSVNGDLLTLYTITDFHLGMYAWAKEGGSDWNLAKAKQCLLKAFGQMIHGSPSSGTAILCNLGDMLHFDGLLAVTPAHQNVLDSDTRYDKLVGMCLELMVWMVDQLLKKHKQVHVICAEGNHDESGSTWLRQSLDVMHRNNKRVTVETTPLPYYGFQHGEVMLGFHHGHKKKEKQIRDVFCSDPKFRAMWGQCKTAYIHSGHLHCQAKFEDGGAIIERHPTLSARDSYAARHGYVSHRCAHAITYHKAKGEVSRVTVVPEVD